MPRSTPARRSVRPAAALIDADRPPDVCSGQVQARLIGSLQACAAEIRIAKARAGQVGSGQVRAAQDGALCARAGEVRPPQVDARQLDKGSPGRPEHAASQPPTGAEQPEHHSQPLVLRQHRQQLLSLEATAWIRVHEQRPELAQVIAVHAHAISHPMLALLLACTADAPEPAEAPHSHAEEEQLSITPRGIGPYRLGRSRDEILALPDAAPQPGGSVAFRGIVVDFEEGSACEVALSVSGLTTAAGMEVGLPVSEFTRAHGEAAPSGDLLSFANAAWMRVRADGADPPRAAAIVLGECGR